MTDVAAMTSQRLLVAGAEGDGKMGMDVRDGVVPDSVDNHRADVVLRCTVVWSGKVGCASGGEMELMPAVKAWATPSAASQHYQSTWTLNEVYREPSPHFPQLSQRDKKPTCTLHGSPIPHY